MPQYSCPIGVGCGIALMPRYGHKSDPHTHVAHVLMIASVGLMIFGISRSSNRTSRGPYKLFLASSFSLYFALGIPKCRIAPSSLVHGKAAIHGERVTNHERRARSAEPQHG